MNKMQQMVQDFHKKYNHSIGYSPSILQPEPTPISRNTV